MALPMVVKVMERGLEGVGNGYGHGGSDGGNGKSTGDGETKALPGWR